MQLDASSTIGPWMAGSVQQPCQDPSATPPLSQGLQVLMEGTMRSQHSELQPACLHLQRSRGAGSVPSAEHVQGKGLCRGETGDALP